MAKIYIRDLELRTIIGINDWEREKKQDIVINISIDFDAGDAVQSDAISDTVDYKSITKKIIDFVEQSKFYLLEKLTDQVLNIIIQEPRVLASKVCIDKPHALRFAKSVSVELCRTRDER